MFWNSFGLRIFADINLRLTLQVLPTLRQSSTLFTEGYRFFLRVSLCLLCASSVKLREIKKLHRETQRFTEGFLSLFDYFYYLIIYLQKIQPCGQMRNVYYGFLFGRAYAIRPYVHAHNIKQFNGCCCRGVLNTPFG